MNRLGHILLIILSTLSLYTFGQDDLLDLLEEEVEADTTVDYTFATFKATRVINGPICGDDFRW